MNAIQILEHNCERVLTTEQLAHAYECGAKRISENFTRNATRFEEGKHYYKIEGNELKDLQSANCGLQISPMARVLYLWTRRGASRHSKMLGTNKAWDMFDQLEENYFNPRPKALTPAEQMAQVIGELKPKADYTDKILQNKGLVTITQIAKDYGMSGQAINRILHELKVIYSKYQACGYTHSETIQITRKDGSSDVRMNTKWTQKGRLFIYNLLKNNGILPVVEQLPVAAMGEVETFRYNTAGVERFRELVKADE